MGISWDEWRGSMDGRPAIWIKRLLRWRGRRVDLHKIVAPDDADCFHTHPALAVRVILRGGYIEEMEDGTLREWRPGMAGLIRAEYCHRIHALRRGPSYSLWLRGRVTDPVRLAGFGWAEQKQTHRAANTVMADANGNWDYRDAAPIFPSQTKQD